MSSPVPAELQAILDEKRCAGRVDSSGGFTLDLKRAQVKLQRFALADPAYYILKVLQAGVASGSPLLSVQLKRRETRLAFQWPHEEAIPTGELLTALGNPTGAARPAVRHLAIGLNAAVGVNPRSIEWVAWDGQAGQWIEIQGGEVSVAELDEPPWDPPTAGYRLVLHRSWWRTLLPQAAGEHQALYGRCRFSPVPIYLDSRLVNAPDLNPWTLDVNFKHSPWLPEGYNLAERYRLGDTPRAEQVGVPDSRVAHAELVDRDGEVAPPRKFRRGECRVFVHQTRGQSAEDTFYSCSTAFIVPIDLQGPVTAHFVKFGVTVDVRRYDWPLPGARVVTSAASLQEDLSQFRLAENPAYQEHIDFLEQQLSEMREDVFRQLPQLTDSVVRGGQCLGLMRNHVGAGLAFPEV